MNLRKLQAMAMGGLHGKPQFTGQSQDGTSTQNTTGTNDMTPEQQEQYRRLLANADEFLAGSGYEGTGNEYLQQQEAAMSAQQQAYQDTLSGKTDTAALEGALNAQREAAGQNLDRTLTGVTEQANMQGGSGGSRQSIAEGIAIGDANAALSQQQAQTTNDFYQNELARKQAAAQGMGQNAAGWQGVQDGLTNDADNQLKNLSAYQQLISGNMGGVTETDSKTTGSTESGGWGFKLSDKNMKKDIKKVGETTVKGSDKKVGLYDFEYTEDAKKDEGAPGGKQRGVLAQEVEKVNPDAVKEQKLKKDKKKKAKKVNYDMVGV